MRGLHNWTRSEPRENFHMVHENGKKRARHGRLAIRRQIVFCPMHTDHFIRPSTFVVTLVASFYHDGWCLLCNAELRAGAWRSVIPNLG
jgi:hypothetical protein